MDFLTGRVNILLLGQILRLSKLPLCNKLCKNMEPSFILYSTFPYCIISEIYIRKYSNSNCFMYSFTFCHNFFQLYNVCIVKYILAVKIVIKFLPPALYYISSIKKLLKVFLKYSKRESK